MSKGKPTKLRPDVAEVAFRVFQEAVGDAPKTKPPAERSGDEKNAEAVARGAKGGRKGGKARADKLTEVQRQEVARKAARARWKKEQDNP